MVYTQARGAQGYNSRLHYSLYGGVEYYPHDSFALKEVLPLIAVPVVCIALLTAVLSFHVPTLSPATGASGDGNSQARNSKAYSLVLAPTNSSVPRGNNGATLPSRITGYSSSSAAFSPTTLTPLGSDSGQGIIGGMGGGDATGTTISTSTLPTSPTTDPITSTTSPLVQANASSTLDTSNGTAQVGVDVFLAPTNTTLSTNATLAP